MDCLFSRNKMKMFVRETFSFLGLNSQFRNIYCNHSLENHTILLLIYLAYPICGRVNDLLLSLPTSDYHYSFNYCSPRHSISSFTQGPLGTLGSVTIMHLLTRTISYCFQSLSDNLLFTRKH